MEVAPKFFQSSSRLNLGNFQDSKHIIHLYAILTPTGIVGPGLERKMNENR
jgi:hypothetical protein